MCSRSVNNRTDSTMRAAHLGLALLAWPLHAAATILQNGQVREDPYPGQAPRISLDGSWRNYPPDAPEISYKGRWDSKHISCMSSRTKRAWFLTGFRVVVRDSSLGVGLPKANYTDITRAPGIKLEFSGSQVRSTAVAWDHG